LNKSSRINHLYVTANQPAEPRDLSKLPDWLAELLLVPVQVDVML
jgi:hypothetical protein